ncbi:acyl-CoA dehydrogenase [Dactylosporangium sp. NPDC005572]|uniref:acyl-CoA dehydrogenase n=1 Tax=Dactylosporangium sp. NPDC005572 TaxID=3156889 RepID=UPI0033B0331F
MSAAKQRQLRRNDYSLDEQQQAVHEAFADFFTAECPSSRVRAAEPLGFDQALWGKVRELGAVSMAVPADRGGDGATLIDLVLVAEQYGRVLAPVPLIEAVAAARLLARLDADAAADFLAATLTGEMLPTLALHQVGHDPRQIVPAGAVARQVLALHGQELVLITAAAPPEHVENMAHASLAWWDLSAQSGDRQVLAAGPRAVEAFAAAVREWKLLTGAALASSGDDAVRLAVDFVSSRTAFGQLVGSFQAVANAIVDAATAVSAARNLTRKAAWFAEYAPHERRELQPMAYLASARAAVQAATTAVHVQGGFGFSVESDVTLHFRRAKGWSVLAGDPSRELFDIAAHLPASFQ